VHALHVTILRHDDGQAVGHGLSEAVSHPVAGTAVVGGLSYVVGVIMGRHRVVRIAILRKNVMPGTGLSMTFLFALSEAG